MGFDTEDNLVDYIWSEEDSRTSNIWGGVVFTNDFPNGTTLPQHLKYKIRPRSEQRYQLDDNRPNVFMASDWYTGVMYPLFQMPGPRNEDEFTGGSPCQ